MFRLEQVYFSLNCSGYKTTHTHKHKSRESYECQLSRAIWAEKNGTNQRNASIPPCALPVSLVYMPVTAFNLEQLKSIALCVCVWESEYVEVTWCLCVCPEDKGHPDACAYKKENID